MTPVIEVGYEKKRVDAGFEQLQADHCRHHVQAQLLKPCHPGSSTSVTCA
jgi:hypothetical protein